MAINDLRMNPSYTFVAKLWLYSGEGAWCFVTLPKKYGDEIRTITDVPRRGFGSIRVRAQIGSMTWDTSIFPDKRSGSYILPVKKEVRQKSDLQINKDAEVKLILKDL